MGLPLPRLREARAKRGYTLTSLAEASGVARSAIAAIEKGHRNARATTMRDLAETLDVSIAYLTGEAAPARQGETFALASLWAEERGVSEDEAERQIRARREQLERRARGGRRRLGLPRGERIVLAGGGENAASDAVSAVRGS